MDCVSDIQKSIQAIRRFQFWKAETGSMTSSSSVVKTTNPSNDDFFLCRAFATAISSDKLLQIIEQQPISIESEIVETNVSSHIDVQMVEDSLSPSENIQWKVGDLCVCPYSEDGLLYKATIINMSSSSSSCTVSFDDYGNEETHPLTDLQIRAEEEQQEPVSLIDEHDILPPPPPPPPFPILNSNEDNDSLSSTLMSWYLAGYHTGFYQGIKDNKNTEK